MKDYGPELFKGTAHYYSKYRPPYPAELIRYIVSRFALDGRGELLDLGCGTGQLTVRFADWFEKITGVDNETEMLQEARRITEEMRFCSVDWVQGNAENYIKGLEHKSFRFVIIAKAFHWMNRARVLEQLYSKIERNGGVAIIDSYTPDRKEPTDWQIAVEKVVKKWYGPERRAGNSTYTHPTVSHEDIVAASLFEAEVHRLPVYEHSWTIESIIGNLYSTSHGARRFLGDQTALFEKELEKALLNLDSSGIFRAEMHTSITLAVKNH
ncbi:class I SAM-dependent methyltransferase [Paenibacillus medicaginis]|uniref:Class I SAM-dependent methyltransferase n=1 Tax=Paenibacillus medicaginis TaxID=1470560 RepID=A0ABV5BXZ7_9BACL